MNWESFIVKEMERVEVRQSLIDEHKKNALKKAKEISRFFVNKYSVNQVILFGSMLTDQFSMESDIDLAVKGLSTECFFRAFSEAEEIALPFKIDIIDLNQKPSMWEYVRRGEILYES